MQPIGFHKKKNRHRRDNEGAAMVMVLIVTAVILVFCLSLLLVTYSLLAQTVRQTTRMQCKWLAQSFSEALQKEITDPDSDLCSYLAEQITAGKWTDSAEPDGNGQLVLFLDEAVIPADYNLKVVLTYSQNTAEDDVEEPEEEDDQDNTEPDGKQLQNSTAREKTDPDQEVQIYTMTAEIRCVRGAEDGSDTQSYELECVYPAVSLP